MDAKQRETDEAIGRYVIRLQERYPEFARNRRYEMRLRGYDALSQTLSEHFWMGNRETYEKMLGEMLTDEERELLLNDPNFTKAWRVFTELRWIRKQLERALLIGAGALVLIILAVGLGWTFYQVVVSLRTPARK